MSGSSDDLALSTTIQMTGEALHSEKTHLRAAMIDVRPVLRCDLPLPSQEEMADDGGAAALIARSRKLSDSSEN